MNLVCPKCGAPIQFTDKVCSRCGESLAGATGTTLHMRVDPELLRLRHSYPASNLTLLPDQAVCLKIRGLNERIFFQQQTAVILGRVELNQSADGTLDLTRYGALQRGVSRAHARLQYDGDKLILTDLGSVNGTWINERKLEPNQPVEVHNGDELLLGHLPIKVTFVDVPRAKSTEAESDTLILPGAQRLQAEMDTDTDSPEALTDQDDNAEPTT